MKDAKESTSHDLWTVYLSLALILANTFSLLASYHWVFDVFSNFKIQYFFIGLSLLALCTIYKQKWFALCMAILAVSLFIEVQYANMRPFASKPLQTPNFKIAQYNKFFGNEDYDAIRQWLTDPKEGNFDLVAINESLMHAIRVYQRIKDIYPHQYPLKESERFGDIQIVSKWPITVTPLPIHWDNRVFNVSKIAVRKPGLEPVIVYAYHAQTPLGAYGYERRQYELETMAKFVAAQNEKNVIMMGDWNLTPYSPLFKDILRTTGLNYQNYGLLPQTTWPSFNYFNVLKIPIDHILYDDRMVLTDIRRGPSMGSDHHSLIAQFFIKPE